MAVSLSSDGRILAVGGSPATQIFRSDGLTYQELGNALTRKSRGSEQGEDGILWMRHIDVHDVKAIDPSGKSTSMSSDGRFLAAGGPGDNAGMGATWIFQFNGSTYKYKQLGEKLFGLGSTCSEFLLDVGGKRKVCLEYRT